MTLAGKSARLWISMALASAVGGGRPPRSVDAYPRSASFLTRDRTTASFSRYIYSILCVYFTCTCICMHRVHSLRRTEDVGSPGPGDMNVCEALCGHWELSLGPVQVQMLLTAELTLPPSTVAF